MRRLCERPGCSGEGSVSYGMVPEELVFWLESGVGEHARALCRRHADAMVVPRGWTLDDRRQPAPQLFSAARFASDDGQEHPRARGQRRKQPGVEQLVIDGTDEIERPAPVDAEQAHDVWVASFDPDDDLDGVLRATSPLLSRAFRGDRRPT